MGAGAVVTPREGNEGHLQVHREVIQREVHDLLRSTMIRVSSTNTLESTTRGRGTIRTHNPDAQTPPMLRSQSHPIPGDARPFRHARSVRRLARDFQLTRKPTWEQNRRGGTVVEFRQAPKHHGVLLPTLSISDLAKVEDLTLQTMTSAASVLSMASLPHSHDKSKPPVYPAKSKKVTMNLKVDISSPPADSSGLTLMSDALGSMRRLPSMRSDRRSLTSYQDEEDWIKIPDEDDPLDESIFTPREARARELSVNVHPSADESYRFTRSGAIRVDGVEMPIRQTGISMAPSSALTLQERVVRLEKLGQGATGSVFKAFDLVNFELVALKEIPIFDRVKRRQMVQELLVLFRDLRTTQPVEVATPNGKSLQPRNSDCVVGFIDAFSNMEEATVSLMVEYMNGGSLQNIVDAGGCSHEPTLSTIMRHCLMGLDFLHKASHLHRDIKPANLLINLDGIAKISDFGIVRKLEHTASETEENSDDGMMDPGGGSPKNRGGLKCAHTFVGTVTYMSPERLNGEAYSQPSDVWSLGLSVMACALGKTPLRSYSGYWSLLQCVRDEPPPQLPEGDWSEEFRDILSKCLQKDPSCRPSAESLLSHPFITLHERPSPSSPVADRDTTPMNEATEDDHFKKSGLSELSALLQSMSEHIQMIFKLHRNDRLKAQGLIPASCTSWDEAVKHILSTQPEETYSHLSSQLNIPAPVLRQAISAFCELPDDQ